MSPLHASNRPYSKSTPVLSHRYAERSGLGAYGRNTRHSDRVQFWSRSRTRTGTRHQPAPQLPPEVSTRPRLGPQGHQDPTQKNQPTIVRKDERIQQCCVVRTYRICDVAQARTLQMSRQTPIVPIFRASPVRFRRGLIPPELNKRSLHKRKHLLHDHQARRARDRVEDVRELECGEHEPASLRLAFP